jgi:hypothetical protein
MESFGTRAIHRAEATAIAVMARVTEKTVAFVDARLSGVAAAAERAEGVAAVEPPAALFVALARTAAVCAVHLLAAGPRRAIGAGCACFTETAW